MKTYFSYFLILILTVQSCSKTENAKDEVIEEEDIIEEPKLSAYFTLKTGCSLVLGSFDFWVILHSTNGELIDFKPFNYLLTESLEFKALEDAKPDKFTVTILNISSESGNPEYSISSFTQFNKGEVLDYSCEEIKTSTKTGTFNLVVRNIPNINGGITDFSAWNGEASGLLTPGLINEGSFVTYFGDLDVLESKKDYIISIRDGYGGSKYYVLSNYNSGDEIVLDYSDFSSFDKYLDINFPLNYRLSFNLEGLTSETNEVYALGAIFSTGGPEGILRAGQLDRFDSYRVRFTVKPTLEYEYQYKEFGQLPSEIVIPEKPSIIIENSSIKNFKFTTELSGYLHKTSFWTSFDGTAFRTWSIQSKENYSPIIGDLPEELLGQYPNLNLEDLSYSQTNFQLNDEETIILLNPN
jgi:hypothetical protein